MMRRPEPWRWWLACGAAAAGAALYAFVLIPAYHQCRVTGGTFWTCSHWLFR